jgi:hypothetical protein
MPCCGFERSGRISTPVSGIRVLNQAATINQDQGRDRGLRRRVDAGVDEREVERQQVAGERMPDQRPPSTMPRMIEAMVSPRSSRWP